MEPDVRLSNDFNCWGKKLVVLVGQKKAVAIDDANVSGRRRWSKLRQWLRPNPSLSRQIDVAI